MTMLLFVLGISGKKKENTYIYKIRQEAKIRRNPNTISFVRTENKIRQCLYQDHHHANQTSIYVMELKCTYELLGLE